MFPDIRYKGSDPYVPHEQMAPGAQPSALNNPLCSQDAQQSPPLPLSKPSLCRVRHLLQQGFFDDKWRWTGPESLATRLLPPLLPAEQPEWHRQLDTPLPVIGARDPSIAFPFQLRPFFTALKSAPDLPAIRYILCVGSSLPKSIQKYFFKVCTEAGADLQTVLTPKEREDFLPPAQDLDLRIMVDPNATYKELGLLKQWVVNYLATLWDSPADNKAELIEKNLFTKFNTTWTGFNCYAICAFGDGNFSIELIFASKLARPELFRHSGWSSELDNDFNLTTPKDIDDETTPKPPSHLKYWGAALYLAGRIIDAEKPSTVDLAGHIAAIAYIGKEFICADSDYQELLSIRLANYLCNNTVDAYGAIEKAADNHQFKLPHSTLCLYLNTLSFLATHNKLSNAASLTAIWRTRASPTAEKIKLPAIKSLMAMTLHTADADLLLATLSLMEYLLAGAGDQSPSPISSRRHTIPLQHNLHIEGPDRHKTLALALPFTLEQALGLIARKCIATALPKLRPFLTAWSEWLSATCQSLKGFSSTDLAVELSTPAIDLLLKILDLPIPALQQSALLLLWRSNYPESRSALPLLIQKSATLTSDEPNSSIRLWIYRSMIQSLDRCSTVNGDQLQAAQFNALAEALGDNSSTPTQRKWQWCLALAALTSPELGPCSFALWEKWFRDAKNIFSSPAELGSYITTLLPHNIVAAAKCMQVVTSTFPKGSTALLPHFHRICSAAQQLQPAQQPLLLPILPLLAQVSKSLVQQTLGKSSPLDPQPFLWLCCQLFKISYHQQSLALLKSCCRLPISPATQPLFLDLYLKAYDNQNLTANRALFANMIDSFKKGSTLQSSIDEQRRFLSELEKLFDRSLAAATATDLKHAELILDDLLIRGLWRCGSAADHMSGRNLALTLLLRWDPPRTKEFKREHHLLLLLHATALEPDSPAALLLTTKLIALLAEFNGSPPLLPAESQGQLLAQAEWLAATLNLHGSAKADKLLFITTCMQCGNGNPFGEQITALFHSTCSAHIGDGEFDAVDMLIDKALDRCLLPTDAPTLISLRQELLHHYLDVSNLEAASKQLRALFATHHSSLILIALEKCIASYCAVDRHYEGYQLLSDALKSNKKYEQVISPATWHSLASGLTCDDPAAAAAILIAQQAALAEELSPTSLHHLADSIIRTITDSDRHRRNIKIAIDLASSYGIDNLEMALALLRTALAHKTKSVIVRALDIAMDLLDIADARKLPTDEQLNAWELLLKGSATVGYEPLFMRLISTDPTAGDHHFIALLRQNLQSPAAIRCSYLFLNGALSIAGKSLNFQLQHANALFKIYDQIKPLYRQHWDPTQQESSNRNFISYFSNTANHRHFLAAVHLLNEQCQLHPTDHSLIPLCRQLLKRAISITHTPIEAAIVKSANMLLLMLKGFNITATQLADFLDSLSAHPFPCFYELACNLIAAIINEYIPPSRGEQAQFKKLKASINSALGHPSLVIPITQLQEIYFHENSIYFFEAADLTKSRAELIKIQLEHSHTINLTTTAFEDPFIFQTTQFVLGFINSFHSFPDRRKECWLLSCRLAIKLINQRQSWSFHNSLLWFAISQLPTTERVSQLNTITLQASRHLQELARRLNIPLPPITISGNPNINNSSAPINTNHPKKRSLGEEIFFADMAIMIEAITLTSCELPNDQMMWCQTAASHLYNLCTLFPDKQNLVLQLIEKLTFMKLPDSAEYFSMHFHIIRWLLSTAFKKGIRSGVDVAKLLEIYVIVAAAEIDEEDDKPFATDSLLSSILLPHLTREQHTLCITKAIARLTQMQHPLHTLRAMVIMEANQNAIYSIDIKRWLQCYQELFTAVQHSPFSIHLGLNNLIVLYTILKQTELFIAPGTTLSTKLFVEYFHLLFSSCPLPAAQEELSHYPLIYSQLLSVISTDHFAAEPQELIQLIKALTAYAEKEIDAAAAKCAAAAAGDDKTISPGKIYEEMEELFAAAAHLIKKQPLKQCCDALEQLFDEWNSTLLGSSSQMVRMAAQTSNNLWDL
jgi:hypothetical protein